MSVMSQSFAALLLSQLAVWKLAESATYFNHTYLKLTMNNAGYSSYDGVYLRRNDLGHPRCNFTQQQAATPTLDLYDGNYFYQQAGSTKFLAMDGDAINTAFWRLVMADTATLGSVDCVDTSNPTNYDFVSTYYIIGNAELWPTTTAHFYVTPSLNVTFTLCAADPSTCSTSSPTSSPTLYPSGSPSGSPSKSPSSSPSKSPSASPSKSPSDSPSKSPTKSPSASPSKSPSDSPSKSPTKSPSASPSKSPSGSPSKSPTTSPSNVPSATPTSSPSDEPTEEPTEEPTYYPTNYPTNYPTDNPTMETTEIIFSTMTTDDELCDIGQGLAFLSVESVCQFCTCSNGARQACQAVAAAIADKANFAPNLAALFEAECPHADYEDLQDEEGNQCELEALSVKSDATGCDCSSLECGETDGAMQYGVMMAVVIAVVAWSAM